MERGTNGQPARKLSLHSPHPSRQRTVPPYFQRLEYEPLENGQHERSPRKIRMGRLCDICGCERPNEAFGGGRGPRSHICNRCMRMPKHKRKLLEAELLLSSFFGQTHISDRNISRIRLLAASPGEQVSVLASEMLEVLSVAPTLRRKKGRRSIAVTPEMRSNICERWGNAGVLPEDDETGEQAHPY